MSTFLPAPPGGAALARRVQRGHWAWQVYFALAALAPMILGVETGAVFSGGSSLAVLLARWRWEGCPFLLAQWYGQGVLSPEDSPRLTRLLGRGRRQALWRLAGETVLAYLLGTAMMLALVRSALEPRWRLALAVAVITMAPLYAIHLSIRRVRREARTPPAPTEAST